VGEAGFLSVADNDVTFEPLTLVKNPKLVNARGEKCGVEVNIV
jgi:hypothetical protein